jgi:hypothetical protein
MIKHVRMRDVELVRRVYFAVRDHVWDTIYPDFSNLRMENAGETFRATFDAECRRGNVHYCWQGRIESRADGTITFEATGAPEHDFLSNRIGLCLLLPAESLAGQAFQLMKASASQENGRFSRYVDHSLVGEQFTAIRFQPPGGPLIECAMDGAVFDMEDQRLYMDTTYKAYAPLPHDYPHARAGERHGQTFTMKLVDDTASSYVATRMDEAQAPVVITVEEQTVGQVPLLGLTLNALEGEYALTEPERADLAALRLGHLRVAVDLDDETTTATRLTATASIIPGITDTVLLSARHLTDAAVPVLFESCRPLIRAGLRRLMIEACDAAPDLLPVARLAFSREKIDVLIGGPGSEDCSSHPHLRSWALAEPDFICWAGSAALHQEDDETLMENTLGIAMQLETARQINDRARLGMGPLRLDGPWPRPRPTPRYTGRFAAAWVAAAVKQLGEGGARFATLLDATGPSGVFYRRASFDQPGFDDGEPRPYPSGHIAAWLAGQRGRPMVRADSSAPLRAAAMAIMEHGASEPTLVLINLTFRPQSVRVEGVKDKARIHQFANEHLRLSTRLPGLTAGEYVPRDAGGPVAIAPYSVIWLRPDHLESR